jgi:hypothetical protein
VGGREINAGKWAGKLDSMRLKGSMLDGDAVFCKLHGRRRMREVG